MLAAKKFLKDNPDLISLNVDKGNITVCKKKPVQNFHLKLKDSLKIAKHCIQKTVIFPILAEIVLEDLEEFLFEKLDFDLPYYFRY